MRTLNLVGSARTSALRCRWICRIQSWPGKSSLCDSSASREGPATGVTGCSVLRRLRDGPSARVVSSAKMPSSSWISLRRNDLLLPPELGGSGARTVGVAAPTGADLALDWEAAVLVAADAGGAADEATGADDFGATSIAWRVGDGAAVRLPLSPLVALGVTERGGGRGIDLDLEGDLALRFGELFSMA